MIEKMFPIQSERGARPHPIQIPWSIAELAYSVYSANYGRDQSLERLAERGGFGPGEMDMFVPDWRTRCEWKEDVARLVDEAGIAADVLAGLGATIQAERLRAALAVFAAMETP